MNEASAIHWISHRGLSHHHNENTLESFQRACEQNFSHLETDLHSTLDHHIVLSHDATLEGISNHCGQIKQMTRAELEAIDLNKGGRILFLDQFMEEFKPLNWVFDIKPDSATQTIQNLTPILHNDKTLLTKIIFLFWSDQDQALFLNNFPDARCFPRIEACYRAGIATLLGLSLFGKIEKNKIYSVTPKFLGLPLLNKRIVKSFHKHHAKVLGYLPENAQETQQCIHAGVDYILTNHPPPC